MIERKDYYSFSEIKNVIGSLHDRVEKNKAKMEELEMEISGANDDLGWISGSLSFCPICEGYYYKGKSISARIPCPCQSLPCRDCGNKVKKMGREKISYFCSLCRDPLTKMEMRILSHRTPLEIDGINIPLILMRCRMKFSGYAYTIYPGFLIALENYPVLTKGENLQKIINWMEDDCPKVWRTMRDIAKRPAWLRAASSVIERNRDILFSLLKLTGILNKANINFDR